MEGTLSVKVQVSHGELLDKISILEIKRSNATASAQRRNIEAELKALLAARDRAVPAGASIGDLYDRLKDVNLRLWAVEDDLRDHERRGAFGARFVELARSVYRLNDLRAGLKRELNTVLGSELVEEKLYRDY